MISFDNTEYAFAYKTSSDLKRARFLFKSMGNNFLLNTGLWLMPWAIKYHLPFTNSILRATIFKQFVGGETLEETATVVDKLAEYKVEVILDYGVEGGNDGDKGYDEATEKFLEVINYAAVQPSIPFISIKVTGIVRFSLLEKIDTAMHLQSEDSLIKNYNSALVSLPVDEKEEWQRAASRLEKICQNAHDKNVAVLVDAEETWIQDPVDALTILMMQKFNETKVFVFNTLQLYRHDRLAFLKKMHEAAKEKNFVLGAKLVRGAYMEKERERAIEKGYPSPIQADKESCDNDYNAAVAYCLENVESIFVIVASHNEQSNMLATELMDKYNLAHRHQHVHFSQLYGMSDNITFNLAKEGFSVSKYLPFGPIKDVIPYLTRRAEENSSVSGQTGRELSLISKELKRRGN